MRWLLCFVQNAVNPQAPCFVSEMIGFAVIVYLETVILLAGFLSLGSRTRQIPKDRRPMFETSKTGGGTLKKNDNFITPKNWGKLTFSRNRSPI